MSKVICDVCGTAYPETSTQCPICGSVNNAESAGMPVENTDAGTPKTYTYVKGGRFSKANVRKRNRANQAAEGQSRPAASGANQRQTPKKKNNTGLLIVIILLLLAIVAVVIFMAVKFFWSPAPEQPEQTEPSTSEQTDPTDAEIPCQGVTLDVGEVVFSELGEARMIYATAIPTDTTDEIIFASSDETVVKVSNSGKLEAVGPGEATITVTCGEITGFCSVICDFELQTEEPTEEVLEKVEIAAQDVWLNRKDITFSFKGEQWNIYSGKMDVTKLEWVSGKDSIVTIEEGVIKAAGTGSTDVSVVYKETEITSTKSIVVLLYENIDEDLLTVTCVDEEGNEVEAAITDGKASFANLDPSKTYTVTLTVECIIRCSFSSSDYQGVGGHGGVGEG